MTKHTGRQFSPFSPSFFFFLRSYPSLASRRSLACRDARSSDYSRHRQKQQMESSRRCCRLVCVENYSFEIPAGFKTPKGRLLQGMMFLILYICVDIMGWPAETEVKTI